MSLLLDRGEKTQLSESVVTGDVIGVGVHFPEENADNSLIRVTFYKNGKRMAATEVAPSLHGKTEFKPIVGLPANAKARINFGILRPFKFEPEGDVPGVASSPNPETALPVADDCSQREHTNCSSLSPTASISTRAAGFDRCGSTEGDCRKQSAPLCSDDEVLQFARHFDHNVINGSGDHESAHPSNIPSIAAPLLGPRLSGPTSNVFPSAMIEMGGLFVFQHIDFLFTRTHLCTKHSHPSATRNRVSPMNTLLATAFGCTVKQA